MSATTITQAQEKGLRHQLEGILDAVCGFATELYAVQGGWVAASAKPANTTEARKQAA